MTGFPNLKPAFTARLKPGEPLAMGSLSNSCEVQVVPIASGTIQSEPDYPISINAEVQYGSDQLQIEATHGYIRINVNAVLRNVSGSYILYKYRGVIEVDPDFTAIFTHSPDAKTTDFGKAFTQIQFETGDQRLRALNYAIFVGSAHFIIDKGGDMVIETKISQVVG